MMRHDGGYKLFFSHPRVVVDLLRGFVREPWVGELDLSTLERVSGSFVSEDGRDRHNDVVWRVLWRREGSAAVPVYLLLEFQSRLDRFMAVRLLTYLSLLYEDVIRNRGFTSSRKLPPVLLVVLYNGNRPWSAPRDLGSLVEPAPGALGGACPSFHYLVLDERRMAPGELADSSNLVASLIRLEVSRSPEEFVELASSLAVQLPKEREPELRRIFTLWALRALRRTFQGTTIEEILDLEEIPMLEETFRGWLRQARTEGRREGRTEGMRELLLQQLVQRFGPLPREVQRKVETISSAKQLQALAEKVLVAGSFEELGLG